MLHVASVDDWSARSSSHYQPASYEAEGFVHCCTSDQLAGVLQRYYVGRVDLVLCTLEPALLDAPLVWENTSGGIERFPHVYGPIALDAVVSTQPLAGPVVD